MTSVLNKAADEWVCLCTWKGDKMSERLDGSLQEVGGGRGIVRKRVRLYKSPLTGFKDT